MGYHKVGAYKGPGVTTGRSGSIGLAFYTEQEYWPLNTSLFVSNFHGNGPKFIYYFFQYFNFKKYASGVSVPTLNRNLVHSVTIGFPQKDEQIEISNILFKIANKEDFARKKLDELNSLFNSTLNQLMTGKVRVKDLNI